MRYVFVEHIGTFRTKSNPLPLYIITLIKSWRSKKRKKRGSEGERGERERESEGRDKGVKSEKGEMKESVIKI